MMMRSTTLFLFGILMCVTSQMALAQVSDIEMAPTDSTAKKKNKKPDVHISGVIQVHYFNEFNTNGDTIRDPDGFRVLRARLIADGKISDKIGYQLMIDPRAPEHGGLLRDAYIEFYHLKNHKIRIGRQKTQFGWENRQSITQLYTVNRAEMSDAVCRGENLRDNGVGLLGNIPINKRWRIEDAITFTNGTRMDVTGPYDFNTKKALWGRVGMRYKKDDWNIRFGGSLGIGGLRYLGDTINDARDDIYVDFKRFGADMQVDHKYFFLAAEYGVGTDKAADTLYQEPVGYQIQLALKTKWNVGPMVRYDTAEDEWKVLTLGAYYGKPQDKLRVLVNYVFRGNVTDIPNGHDDRLYIQMQIVF
ncbi:MAG: porin [Flavobacteriales bacterium]